MHSKTNYPFDYFFEHTTAKTTSATEGVPEVGVASETTTVKTTPPIEDVTTDTTEDSDERTCE